MYTKIREYVNFKLRNDHSDDHKEKKEEIISNIIERYDELLHKTNDESYSYIEAINTIGDFAEESKEEDNYKPELAEMLLISATVLSVISLIVTLLSGVAGAIITGISITLYSVGAVYLYQYSKFVQVEEYDISKYNTFIDKAFSYMKTNFIFWALSFSLIFSRMIYSFVFLIASLIAFNNLRIEDLYGVYAFSIIGFLIVLSIISSIFIRFYRRLMMKYTDLTGKKDVKSVGSKAKEFISSGFKLKSNFFSSKWFYPSLHLIVIILLILDTNIVSDNSVHNWYHYSNFLITENIVIISLYLILTLLFLLNKIKNHIILPLFNILVSIIVFIIWIGFGYAGTNISSFNGLIFFCIGIVFILLFIIDFSLNKKIK